MLQSLLALALLPLCFLPLLFLVVFKGHDYVRNEHDVGHERGQPARVGCVAWGCVSYVMCSPQVKEVSCTIEYKVYGEKIRANGQHNHGKGKAHQLPNHRAARPLATYCEQLAVFTLLTYLGTAGAIFDGSDTPAPSWSRKVFSLFTIRRVVMVRLAAIARIVQPIV